jgi:hypothetical protein
MQFKDNLNQSRKAMKDDPPLGTIGHHDVNCLELEDVSNGRERWQKRRREINKLQSNKLLLDIWHGALCNKIQCCPSGSSASASLLE